MFATKPSLTAVRKLISLLLVQLFVSLRQSRDLSLRFPTFHSFVRSSRTLRLFTSFAIPRGRAVDVVMNAC